jgi:hypothetical protein
MLRQKPQWKWTVSMVIATVCGLVASPSAQAVITSCATGRQLMSVGFISGSPIQQTFLDNKIGMPSWTLIARAKNNGPSSVSYQMTITVAGKTCTAGPASLAPGAIGTKNCPIAPEYTGTGLYTLVATAPSAPPSLQWQYKICQN